jgi:hypothetical protein
LNKWLSGGLEPASSPHHGGSMRARSEIEQDGKKRELLILEVLLDIRDELKDIQNKKEVKPKVIRKRRIAKKKTVKNKN